ncbi:MAG: lipoprotein signal peptidase [Gammaproteobacteria bacterium]|nr:lipoprotein signal peptidase [Gammaproteobacteria bacterium]MDE2251620.1 lipoprotein signal peptidase [Gammaproteobacteria bacterium]
MSGWPRVGGRGQSRWLALSAVVIGLDQWSKHLVERSLQMYEAIYCLPVFNLVRAHNPGVAFSMFDDASGWQRWAFSALAAVISVWLVVWLARLGPRANLQGAALALILAGAVGNVIDRLRLGYVVDFLQVHWHEHYFPAFNVADSAITIGAGCLLLDALLAGRRPAPA